MKNVLGVEFLLVNTIFIALNYGNSCGATNPA